MTKTDDCHNKLKVYFLSDKFYDEDVPRGTEISPEKIRNNKRITEGGKEQ